MPCVRSTWNPSVIALHMSRSSLRSWAKRRGSVWQRYKAAETQAMNTA